jgi:O-antigen/teichoic acid export membrane protein
MLKQHPKYDTVIKWGKLISITGGAQFIVQVVGFVSGLLIIRLLPIQEYALYTLANTMLGTMIVLADGGISTGVMAQGAKVWQDKEKLGAVLVTGLDLRRKFAVGSLIVATPILIYLLLLNAASLLTTLLIVASLIPAFFAALSDTLLEIVPKLHQDILPLQKNQVWVGVGRLFLTGLTIFIFPWTFVVILASGIPRIYGNIKLKQIAFSKVDSKQIPDAKIRNEILVVVRRMMPESIFYCVSGQITIWILSLFGTVNALASIGAIGKLGAIFNFFAVVFSVLIVPEFAKLDMVKSNLKKAMIAVFVGCFMLTIIIILITSIFSNELLWILGKHYKNLNNELVLSMIAACISFFQVCFFGLNNSRGWVINPILYITIVILTIIVAILMFDVSTLTGILYFNITVTSVQAIILLTYSFYRIYTIKILE